MLPFALLSASLMLAAPMPVMPTTTWNGSVGDAKLAALRPRNGMIATEKEFEKVFKAWNVAEKVPAVDFAKELVLVETTSGSRLNLNATLDEAGDLKALGIATRDFGPGFRYVIIVVPRTGVKTINGKAMPK